MASPRLTPPPSNFSMDQLQLHAFSLLKLSIFFYILLVPLMCLIMHACVLTYLFKKINISAKQRTFTVFTVFWGFFCRKKNCLCYRLFALM